MCVCRRQRAVARAPFGKAQGLDKADSAAFEAKLLRRISLLVSVVLLSLSLCWIEILSESASVAHTSQHTHTHTRTQKMALINACACVSVPLRVGCVVAVGSFCRRRRELEPFSRQLSFARLQWLKIESNENSEQQLCSGRFSLCSPLLLAQGVIVGACTQAKSIQQQLVCVCVARSICFQGGCKSKAASKRVQVFLPFQFVSLAPIE